MKTGSETATRARWLVPEVVQTSAMDCGPAALKCLMEGFGVSASYDRLREACQTDVDGTSIDTLEVVANQLGLNAEQVMVPVEHLLQSASQSLPAIVVVRHTDGATHFVVAWRRMAGWIQLMDPAVGRRWVKAGQFGTEVFNHSLVVPSTGWREWAASPDFSNPTRALMLELGVTGKQSDALLQEASNDPLWFGAAALDASIRFVRSLVSAGGLSKGSRAAGLLAALFRQTHGRTHDIFKDIPPKYWSVEPDHTDEQGVLHLQMRGAVLLRVSGLRNPTGTADCDVPEVPPASPELLAALHQKPANPLAIVGRLLRNDGLLGPWALGGAMAIAAAVVLIELLLFRGLFDIAWALGLPSQRLMAMAGLILFLVILLLIEIPILTESLRYGRHLDTRLRMALLDRLPQLSDRYFQSRPVSDMADRSHSIHLSRMVPAFGLQFIQILCDLVFTLLGIALIDIQGLPVALLIALVAMVVPMLIQPLLTESDLRVRNHAGALHVFNLDALLGLIPIRTHGAERVVRRQQEGLLVEWARAAKRLITIATGAQAVQSVLCLSLVGYLLWEHFQRSGGASGADLLLVFWALKLPSLGQSLMGLAQQYPAQRNVLLRLLEPLNTTEVSEVPETSGPAQPDCPAVSVQLTNGRIVAAGHTILEDLNLEIKAGEHIAIVGTSGAGKSTLLGLLLGWHRLSEGDIRINAAPLSEVNLPWLRSHCAWVDPAIQIWNQSFLGNLNYACDTEVPERIGPVLDQANLRRVLQQLPRGLQTYLGEGGAMLSGGEGQRVRLARALMQQDVKLTLLDEPFRGLDRTQRHTLLHDARQWWRGTTLLCVTHDVAETLAFDRVLVIEGGRIVEDGNPAALAGEPSRYRTLLDAESTLRAGMWENAQWRRLRIDALQS